MKITDVKINGFGVWTGLSVDRLPGDVTVFYGPNEAGKTTLMQFMRTVLYGFTPERRDRYLPPVNGGQPGGGLKVSSLRGVYEIQRRTTLHEEPEDRGDVTVLDSSGSVQSAYQLGSLLGGVDESIFDNVFAIGIREMQELSTLNDSAAAEQLYRLASGLDRVSLIDVMRELNTSRNRILCADERQSQLTQLLLRRENLQREIDELASRGRRWPQLATQRAAMAVDIEEVEQEISAIQKDVHRFDLALQSRDKWWARRQVEEQLAALGPALEVPPDALEQLDAFNSRIKKYRRRLRFCKKQQKLYREDLAKHQVNQALINQGARIQALCEHGPWIGSLEAEVVRLKEEVAALEKEADSRRPTIDMPSGAAKAKLPEISAKTLALLKTPAAKLTHLLKLVDRAQREAEAVKVRTDQTLQRINSELSELDAPSLAVALENAGTRVAQLRRRIELEQRIEQLMWQKKEMEGQNAEAFDEQVMPFERMAWQAGGFMFGSLMMMTGFFGGMLWQNFSGMTGFVMVLIGMVSLAVTVISKLEWERQSHRSLESNDRQLEMVDHQLKEAAAERDELDTQIPSGGGPLDSRLQQAEKHLQHLEQLAPMAAQRHETGQHAEVAERRAAKVADELKEAKKVWQNSLRSAGLPDHLTPADVKQLVRSFRNVMVIRKQLNQRREELENRQRELASLSGRVTEVMMDVGNVPDIESPQSQLKWLANALTEQQQVVQRRDSVRQQYHKLRVRWKKTASGWENANRARRSLLAKANVQNETDLRMMIQRQHQALTLRTQRDELSNQLRLILGDLWSEDSLARELLNHDGDTTETRRQRTLDKLLETKHKLASLHEQRGLLAAEMKTLAEDRRIGEAKLELGCVEEQIVQSVRRWQILATTGLVLESVRGTYESTRQPETLREASLFLQRLTNGQYVRIWTPIEARELRVDDQKGQTLTLDKLSRGTREAVFLGLRLALAAGYARRGSILPMILDDVLVNFDARRVKLAANLLREFAKHGHQLFMFTCHEHIMEIFQSEGADIRVLPSRNGEVVRELPPVVLNLPQPEPEPIVVPVAIVEPEPIPEPQPEPAPKPIRKKRPEPVASIPISIIPSQIISHAEEKPAIVIVESKRPVAPAPIVLSQSMASQTIIAARPNRPEPIARVEPIIQRERVQTQTIRPADPLPTAEAGERRFTWESPEMYWEEDPREASV